MDFNQFKSKKSPSIFTTEFKHQFLDIPEITSHDTPNGRYYMTPDTKERLPSVTTFLKHGQDDSFLTEWRARVGMEEAERISKRATERGTAVHLACENLVLNKPEPEQHAGEFKAMFMQMKTILQSRVKTIYGVETGLWSHKMGIAGRTDLLCDYEGRKTVLDYKNLSSYRKESWIIDYFLQGCAYSIMVEERTGEQFKDIVILAAIEGSQWPQVFHAKRSDYLPLLAERLKAFRKEWERPW
ncbi:hypothetical protein [Ralstonia phage RSP15]|uniref:exonuclease n=1 Tax=Ralstonia phage RSP15 TaxID=1785960 RepID=UPI00074D2F91|nr:exonuclease [Ralstonia phage RSP15]BAU39966.1 hypothetical protein [Ralstonia phage RSP15]